MKHKLLLIIIITFSICSIYAKPDFMLNANFEYSYDTNVFSDPLPLYDSSGDWLKWRAGTPFVQKHSLGLSMNFAYFQSNAARTGLSTCLNIKIPLKVIETKPIAEIPGDYTGNWEYESSDMTRLHKTALFGGIGPIFMARFGFADLGMTIRLSMGAYNLFKKEFILGIQAEPFAHFYVGNQIFIAIQLTYDAHILKFIDDEINIFEKNYQMISAAPSIGIGFRF